MKHLDEMGDRLKSYEAVEANRKLIPLLPVCIRLDGKNFSNFTKDLERPYDVNFHNFMVQTTHFLVDETQACIGYTQSDEISLILYSDKYESQIYFNGRIQKITSVLASLCSVKFYTSILKNEDLIESSKVWKNKLNKIPAFDCRIWNVPNKIEAVNTILWRELDATKNAISMAAQHYYSHSELMNKNSKEKQEMLFKKRINFNDYPDWFKRGTFIQKHKN